MEYVSVRVDGLVRHVRWTLMSVNSVPVSTQQAARTHREATSVTVLKVI